MEIGKLSGKLTLDAKEFYAELHKAVGELQQINKSTKDVDQSIKKAAGAFDGWGKKIIVFNQTLQTARSLFYMFKGTVGQVTSGFVEAADKVDQWRLTLNILLGSAEEANKAFKDMIKYAADVPFTFDEVMEGATALSAVAGSSEELKKWIPIVGDLAAAFKSSGITFTEASTQLMRMISAGAQAADMFREKGVTAMLGFVPGQQYTVEKTKEMILNAYEDIHSRFRGTAEELGQTWSGTMGKIRDQFFLFRTEVMGGGLFDAMKKSANEFLERIKKLKEEGKLAEWAKTIASVTVDAFKAMTIGVGIFTKSVMGVYLLILEMKNALLTVKSEFEEFRIEYVEKHLRIAQGKPDEQGNKPSEKDIAMSRNYLADAVGIPEGSEKRGWELVNTPPAAGSPRMWPKEWYKSYLNKDNVYDPEGLIDLSKRLLDELREEAPKTKEDLARLRAQIQTDAEVVGGVDTAFAEIYKFLDNTQRDIDNFHGDVLAPPPGKKAGRGAPNKPVEMSEKLKSAVDKLQKLINDASAKASSRNLNTEERMVAEANAQIENLRIELKDVLPEQPKFGNVLTRMLDELKTKLYEKAKATFEAEEVEKADNALSRIKTSIADVKAAVTELDLSKNQFVAAKQAVDIEMDNLVRKHKDSFKYDPELQAAIEQFRELRKVLEDKKQAKFVDEAEKDVNKLIAQAQVAFDAVGTYQNKYEVEKASVNAEVNELIVKYEDAFNDFPGLEKLIEKLRKLRLETVDLAQSFDLQKEKLSMAADIIKTAFNAIEGALSDFFEQVATGESASFKDMIGNMMKSLQIAAAGLTAQLLMLAAYEGVMAVVDSENKLAGDVPHAARAMMALQGAGIVGAFVAGSALAGMAHDGMTTIPDDGTWLLQKGERVVDKETNEDLKRFLKDGGKSVSVVVNIEASSKSDLLEALPALKQVILDTVNGEIASGGSTNAIIQTYAK